MLQSSQSIHNRKVWIPSSSKWKWCKSQSHVRLIFWVPLPHLFKDNKLIFWKWFKQCLCDCVSIQRDSAGIWLKKTSGYYLHIRIQPRKKYLIRIRQKKRTHFGLSGSTSGQCNNRVSSQFTRYCGYYLGLTMVGGNQPICGKGSSINDFS